MTCNIHELRRQLDDLQKIMDDYNCCCHDEVSEEEKIFESTKQKCIKAVEKEMLKLNVTAGEGACIIQSIREVV